MSDNPDMAALLDQLGGGNPSLQLMMQLLSSGGNDSAQDEERRRRAKARMARLREEHDILVARNDRLAAALGACGCFGEEPSCRFCLGRGTPGCLPPDMAAFNEMVAPALRRVTQATFQPQQAIQGIEEMTT